MRQEVGAILLGCEQHEVGEALGHHGRDLDQISRAALVTTPLMPTPLPVPAAFLIATSVIARINLNATRTNREALRRGSRAGAERQGKNKTPHTRPLHT